MKKNIFYSWQSDSPNNTNRGLIGDSLEKAVNQITKQEVHIEIAIDRDTRNSVGTPEIANTVFEKIDQCHIYIGDITLINTEGKRTPNPNVLLELGYAAKCIGWQNIICVYNTAYGTPEELPFDLRFRKPLTYHVLPTDDKAPVRKALTEQLKRSIETVLNKQTSKDKIFENIKLEVSHHLMGIANLLYKWLYEYKGFISPEDLFAIIELDESNLKDIFTNKKFIGFQVFKDTEKLQESIQNIINNPIFAKHIDDGKVASLITLINALELLNENIKHRSNLFKPTDKKADDLIAVPATSLNPNNSSNAFILLRKQGEQSGVVLDQGEFAKYRQESLVTYVIVAEDQVFPLILLFKDLFIAISEVVSEWDNSILLNPANI